MLINSLLVNKNNYVRSRLLSAGLAMLLCLVSLSSIAAVPKVVVSIGPVHSLLSMVMKDIGEPTLLIQSRQSPHTQQLNPSVIKQLTQADLIVRIGPDFEIAVDKPIHSVGSNARLIDLIELPQMQLLENRKTGYWANTHEHDTHGLADKEQHLVIDPHLWLSPQNAKVMINAFARELGQLDVKHAQRYRQNAQAAISEIDELQQSLAPKLASIRGVPYMVFHDAYQYFEHQFGLNAVGSMTLGTERMPGAKTLLEIGQLIEQQNVRCLFHEPQYQPRLVKRMAKATGINTAELDPLGAKLTPGPDLWPQLMTTLADNLLSCIGQPSG